MSPAPSLEQPSPSPQFQPAPGQGGPPELVSSAPSGGPPRKPGASPGVQGPATELGRIFIDPVMSRHGPWLGQGGKGPRTRVCGRGLIQQFRAAGWAPQQAECELLPRPPHHTGNASAITRPPGHHCGLTASGNTQNAAAHLPAGPQGLSAANQDLRGHSSKAARVKDKSQVQFCAGSFKARLSLGPRRARVTGTQDFTCGRLCQSLP